MQESKHTELPWEAGTSLTNDGQRAIMATDAEMGKKRVALVDIQMKVKRGTGWQSECAEREANAAYIVRACNVHYELLEALKELVMVAHKRDLDVRGTGNKPAMRCSDCGAVAHAVGHVAHSDSCRVALAEALIRKAESE